MGLLSVADTQYELVLFALVSDSVTQAGFELVVLLPQLSECWDPRYVPPYLLTHSVDWLHWASRAPALQEGVLRAAWLLSSSFQLSLAAHLPVAASLKALCYPLFLHPPPSFDLGWQAPATRPGTHLSPAEDLPAGLCWDSGRDSFKSLEPGGFHAVVTAVIFKKGLLT